MGRGTALSPAELAKINVLKDDGYSPSEVAAIISRSRYAIVIALRAKAYESETRKISRPRKISPKLVCGMTRKARSCSYTATDLRRSFQVNFGMRLIQQLLHVDYLLQ